MHSSLLKCNQISLSTVTFVSSGMNVEFFDPLIACDIALIVSGKTIYAHKMVRLLKRKCLISIDTLKSCRFWVSDVPTYEN